ncbi:MAG: VanW family protein [Lachnospiraceae bacterium]|jgi:vancomycin resistance protein YoaR|nr:VanW family protein [Lachnospiraceae bacterium]
MKILQRDKQWLMILCLVAGFLFLRFGITAQAATEPTIQKGVFAQDINLSGMTGTQAKTAIEEYVSNLGQVTVVLVAGGEQEVSVTGEDLGIMWSNTQIVEEALMLGTGGNVVQRYKALKDLEHENKIFEIELSFNVGAINAILNEKCTPYDQKSVNFSLIREGEEFTIIPGQTGYKLDVESSIDLVYQYLTSQWDGTTCRIPLSVGVETPRGSFEELSLVQDVLGKCETSFTTSGVARSANVTNGCALVNGTLLYPGEEFSTYDAVAPFTEQNGYYMAGSYLNGRVVDSLGGGICQVSTTLYDAVLDAELEVTERHNHSMIVNYVEPSADAAIAESSGKDFRFVNNTQYPIYIEGYIKNKQIYFNIYGHETRDPNRVVTYESEILETILPTTEAIHLDGSRPIGYISIEAAHIGYKAKLWKVVTIDGVEVSRTLVNSSNYKVSPRSATVGVLTQDPNAYNEMLAASGVGSIQHMQNVINLLLGQAGLEVAPPVETPPIEE